MLKYNGKEFRNLEEQVGYLTAAFNSGKLIDELGIKVLGVFPDLATAKEAIRPPYEYGDAFEIGTTKPYNLYIYTRNIEDFFDFGPFPAPGPQGKIGPTPNISINANVTNTTGTPEATVVKTGTDEAPIFNFTFKNIKGERGREGMQGIQGPKGNTGATGSIGPKGDKGDKGDTGPAFKLLGNLTSTSQLPTPTAELQSQGAAYTIPNAEGIKHIWVIQGTDNLLWVDFGISGVQGPKGEDGIGINDLQTVQDIGAPSVTYNTTNGITISSTERYTYSTGQTDVNTEREIPIIASEGIFIDANEGSDKILIKSLSSNIENGTGTGSLVQKRLKSDGVTWTTSKAYQGASTSFGGGTQAGRTEEEFNAYFWDSINNVPLHGGAGKTEDGKIKDNRGLTYEKSYSFGVAEGEQTKALGRGSHSEGYYTKTEGDYSHVEGWKTVSKGLASHAEGEQTTASGDFSHAEGFGTSSKGAASHSEGMSTEAIGEKSHVEGFATRALEMYQHVEGVYNADNPNALHIVGNGTSENARKNAFEVLKDGRAKVQSAPVENDDVVRKLELDGKLTKPTNPSAESAVTMLADGTVGTKPLSEIGGSGGGKLYKHRIAFNDIITGFTINIYRLTPDHIPINSLSTYCNYAVATYGNDLGESYIGTVYFTDSEHISFDGTIINPITEPKSWKTVNLSNVQLSKYEAYYEDFYTVTEM